MPLPNPVISNSMSGVSGLNNLSSSAMGIIQNLLTGGGTSPATTRRANAYYGAGSGLGSSNTDPTSDFLARRGFDLYNEQGRRDEQVGIKDLIALIGGMSGALIPTTGQSLQNNQFQQDFGYRQQRDLADDRYKNRQFKESQDQQLNIPWYLRDATHAAQDKWATQANDRVRTGSYRGY